MRNIKETFRLRFRNRYSEWPFTGYWAFTDYTRISGSFSRRPTARLPTVPGGRVVVLQLLSSKRLGRSPWSRVEVAGPGWGPMWPFNMGTSCERTDTRKTLPSHKLRIRAVIIIYGNNQRINWSYSMRLPTCFWLDLPWSTSVRQERPVGLLESIEWTKNNTVIKGLLTRNVF